jgi:hypothetical protein
MPGAVVEPAVVSIVLYAFGFVVKVETASMVLYTSEDVS